MGAAEATRALGREFGIRAERPYQFAEQLHKALAVHAGEAPPVHIQTLFLWLKGTANPRASTITKLFDFAAEHAENRDSQQRIQKIGEQLAAPERRLDSQDVERVATSFILMGLPIAASMEPQPTLEFGFALNGTMLPCQFGDSSSATSPRGMANWLHLGDPSRLEDHTEQQRLGFAFLNDRFLGFDRIVDLWKDGLLAELLDSFKGRDGATLIIEKSLGASDIVANCLAAHLARGFAERQFPCPFLVDASKLGNNFTLSSRLPLSLWPDDIAAPDWRSARSLCSLQGGVLILTNCHTALRSSPAFGRIVAECATAGIRIVLCCQLEQVSLISSILERSRKYVTKEHSVECLNERQLAIFMEDRGWNFTTTQIRTIIGEARSGLESSGTIIPSLKIPAIAAAIAAEQNQETVNTQTSESEDGASPSESWLVRLRGIVEPHVAKVRASLTDQDRDLIAKQVTT